MGGRDRGRDLSLGAPARLPPGCFYSKESTGALGPLRGCVVAHGPRPSAFPERGRLTVMRLHNRGALRWLGLRRAIWSCSSSSSCLRALGAVCSSQTGCMSPSPPTGSHGTRRRRTTRTGALEPTGSRADERRRRLGELRHIYKRDGMTRSLGPDHELEARSLPGRRGPMGVPLYTQCDLTSQASSCRGLIRLPEPGLKWGRSRHRVGAGLSGSRHC